jgi:hypothetical protein
MYDYDRELRDREDEYCGACGEKIEVEVRSFSTSITDRYKGHCACTQKAQEEAERRQRYDFRNGCKDKTFKQPTIGDLLRSKVK